MEEGMVMGEMLERFFFIFCIERKLVIFIFLFVGVGWSWECDWKKVLMGCCIWFWLRYCLSMVELGFDRLLLGIFGWMDIFELDFFMFVLEDGLVLCVVLECFMGWFWFWYYWWVWVKEWVGFWSFVIYLWLDVI